MSKVQHYYNERVSKSSDLYRQVGKTIQGQPVGEEQLRLIATGITSALGLCSGDTVMDIGCGNGLVTRVIAPKVSRVIGVEQNPGLYESALENSSAENLTYIRSDILDVDALNFNCNKAYMYEVIQHVEYNKLRDFMHFFKSSFLSGSRVFIGGIPDEEKKWHFYNSRSRRCELLEALMVSGDPMGTWFHRDYLSHLGDAYGLRVRIIPQSESLYTSHYRFDCLIEVL
ncbi:MAG: methyltransferase domain-containing protein [Halioglobus sp.]|nr:methyltransferase domain-containing protein [Halioglobus sp.]